MAKIPILCYHNIGAAPDASRFKLLYVGTADFERQLWTLRQLGLRGVSVGEAVRRFSGGASGKMVALTFDDGYADTLIQALPLLKAYGCSATCYLVSGAIGAHNSWDAEYLSETKPLMNEGQVREWLAAGMEIGSHSRSHPHLETLDGEAAYEEIAQSREELRARFDIAIDHFAYPYGRVTGTTAALVRRAGYASAVSLLRGVASESDDRHRLPRIFVDGQRSWARFLLQVATPFENLRRAR